MKYTDIYESPLGRMVLAADEEGLTGLWFEGQKYFGAGLSGQAQNVTETDGTETRDSKALGQKAGEEWFCQAKEWLSSYFKGEEPGKLPGLHLCGTEFQRAVWEILLEIPYGETTTYGAIAKKLARRLGRASMSAQAVGQAVGRNKISVIVPCHRVVGADGSLTGYAGGTWRKQALFDLEKKGRER